MATEVSTADSLALSAGRIRGLLKKSATSIIEIGKELIEAKSMLPHGKFHAWVESEIGIDRRVAANFVRIATRFDGQMSGNRTFGIEVLTLLSSPSVPDAAIDEALAESEPVTVAKAKEIVAKHKPPPEPIEAAETECEEYESDADDDTAEVEKVLRGEYKEQHAERKSKTDADILTEKIQKLIESVDRMVVERMGHNAKSRAVVEHLSATIPLIKAMQRSWRNS
jgi:uncharacterized protein YdaT